MENTMNTADELATLRAHLVNLQDDLDIACADDCDRLGRRIARVKVSIARLKGGVEIQRSAGQPTGRVFNIGGLLIEEVL